MIARRLKSSLSPLHLMALLLCASSPAQAGSGDGDGKASMGTVPFGGRSVGCVTVSPDGRTLAVGGAADRKRALLVLWDLRADKETGRLKMDIPPLRRISFSADGGRLLAVPGNGPSIVVYDVKAGKVERTLSTGSKAKIFSAVFSSSGGRVAAVCSDKQLRVFDVAGGKPVRTVAVWDLGQHIVSNPKEAAFIVTSGSKIAIWDFKTVAVRKEIDLLSKETYPFSLAWSPDGRFLAGGGFDGKVRIWDLAAGKVRYTLSHQAGYRAVFCVQFSADGKVLAARAGQLPDKKSVAAALAMMKAGSPARVWDLRSGKVLADRKGSWVCPMFTAGNTLAFTPDGRTLAMTRRTGVALHQVPKATTQTQPARSP